MNCSARRIDLVHAHGALPCGHAAMLLSVSWVFRTLFQYTASTLFRPGRSAGAPANGVAAFLSVYTALRGA